MRCGVNNVQSTGTVVVFFVKTNSTVRPSRVTDNLRGGRGHYTIITLGRNRSKNLKKKSRSLNRIYTNWFIIPLART